MSKPIKVGDVLEIISGFAFKSELFTKDKTQMQLIRIRDIDNGYSDTFYSGVYSKQYIVKKDDLLISLDGEFKISKWTGKDGLLNQRVCKIKSNKDVLIDDYIMYFLPKKLKEIEDKTSFVTVKHLSTNTIKDISISLPSIAEQKRIVKILDQADALRQKRKQAIELLDEYLKSVFLEMFGDPVRNPKGWEVKSLQNLTSTLGDGLHGTPSYSENGDYYFINGNNLENGKIIIKDSTKKVSLAEFKKYKKPLDETSMLVSINGTLGRIAFYNGEKIILGKSACYFNVRQGEVNSVYLYHILKSDFFLKYAMSNSTGSTIQNVSLKTMREFRVICPPLILQDQFVKVVQKTESVMQKMHLQSQDLENQFQVLMQRAFKGEL